jgi:hypothetical protein
LVHVEFEDGTSAQGDYLVACDGTRLASELGTDD